MPPAAPTCPERPAFNPRAPPAAYSGAEVLTTNGLGLADLLPASGPGTREVWLAQGPGCPGAGRGFRSESEAT